MSTANGLVLVLLVAACDGRTTGCDSTSHRSEDEVVRQSQELRTFLAAYSEGDGSPKFRPALKKFFPAEPEVVGVLVRELANESWVIRRRAAVAIGIVVGGGEQHVSPLVAAASDDSKRVRSAAIGSMHDLLERGLHSREARIRAALVGALDDVDAYVRKTAALACVLLGPAQQDDKRRYLAVAQDPDTAVRAVGVQLIAWTGKRFNEVGAVLRRALVDSAADVRGAAARGLAAYYEPGTRVAIDAVGAALLRETDEIAAEAMSITLSYLASNHAGLIAKRLGAANRLAALKLITALHEALPSDAARVHVRRLLDSKDAEIRSAAAGLLAAWDE